MPEDPSVRHSLNHQLTRISACPTMMCGVVVCVSGGGAGGECLILAEASQWPDTVSESGEVFPSGS